MHADRRLCERLSRSMAMPTLSPAVSSPEPPATPSPRRTRSRVLIGSCAAVLALALGACGTTDTTAERVADTSTLPATTTSEVPSEVPLPTATPVVTVSAAPAANKALATLDTLEVKGRAPKTGYDRDLFGQAWTDDVNVDSGHNGCDTRNDILRRDLTDIVLKPGSNGCAVQSGTLADPYTGTTIPFVRGPQTSSAVQIDHVVALSDAWQKGAQQLSAAQRADFANDPRNLQATDGPINQQKGDGDAATWLPPNRSYRCTYVARQVEIKAAYQLWVTQAEKDAITRVLGSCGAAVPAPTTRQVPNTRTSTATPIPEPTYTPPPTTTYTPPPAVEAPSSVYYANCSAVRAAGAAPIYAGQPGYSSKLDRDGDGVACE
ncbi:excalibur calcium-binding domain-containing protein [Gordonia terrae]|uniref:Excalibur calcium-binding domain-containing protein n=2 Tax=Gordonia TaxID=2053 RepID=A0AAW6RC18_GORRU|nr:DUF1524 domain-containing protein [Gordonia rubripertincta]MCZ4537949.1 excalibur calcium-binding domain-containing protein [Gordonia terrae]MDG6782984.1 excalibur calcium-binding domain-containing protein [Gordonia rubripertincta]